MKKQSVYKRMAFSLWGLLLGLVLFSSHSFAQSAGPSQLNISGGLYNPNGTAVTNSSVNFRLEIRDKNNACVLYSEQHMGQDLSQTKGGFALEIGSGSSKANYIDAGSATALSSKVFENPGAVAPFTGCAAGVTLASGDNRVIRVYYDLGSGFTAMSPDVPIASSAYAMVAESLQGKRPTDFIQVRDDATYDLNQTNVESIFSAVNFAKLSQILSGNWGNTTLTNVGTPSAGTDATNKSYVDANIGGKIADVTTVGPAAGNGHTLIWDQAQNRWVTGVPSATDNTKLPLAGGTMTGAIAMGAQNITNIGHMTMAAQRTLNLGTYDDTQEGVLVGTLGVADKGKIWFNSQSNVFKVWNGSAAVSTFGASGSAGGDLTGTYPNPTITTNAITAAKINNTGIAVNRLLITDATTGATVGYKTCNLSESLMWTATGWDCVTVANFLGNSGVTAATYGSATQVAQVQVNAQGRVTSALNVNIDFPVISVAGKTGAVNLNSADISGLGTAAVKNFGTAAGNLVELDGTGKIPTSLLPSTSGDIQDVIAGSGLIGGGSSGQVTLSVDTGITTGKIVQMAASDKLPAVDGSNLTAVNAVRLQSRDVSSSAPTSAQVLTWNAALSTWEPQALPGITVSQVFGAFAQGGNSFGAAATIGTNDNFELNFEANGSLAMTILPSGSVGIGTTSPTNKLHVAGHIFAQNWIQTSGLVNSTYSTSAALPYPMQGAATSSQFVVQNTSVVDSTMALQRFMVNNSSSNTQNAYISAVSNSGAGVYSPNLVFGLQTGASSYSERMRIDSSGNVGVGTANPTDSLVVVGSANGSGSGHILVQNTFNGSNAYGGLIATNSSGAITEFGMASANFNIYSAVPGNSSFIRNVTNGGISLITNAQPIRFFKGDNSTDETLRISNTGDVGIGTNNPQSLLHVNGVVRATDICDENGANCKDISGGWGGGGDIDGVYTSTGLTGGFASGSGTLSVDVGTTTGKIIQVGTSDKLPVIDGSNLTFVNAVKLQTRDVSSTAPTANQVLAWNAASSVWEARTPDGVAANSLDFTELKDAMTLDASTNITVSGTNSLSITNTGTGNTMVFNDQTSDTSPSVIDANGNFGVGTSTPLGKLDVLNQLAANANTVTYPLRVSSTVGGNSGQPGYGTGMMFHGSTDSSTGRMMAAIESVYTDFTDASRNADLIFKTADNASAATPPSEKMRIISTGNVGIGTTNPQSLLDVNGIVRATDICDENGANCKDISGGWGAGGDIDGIYTATGLTGGFASGSGTLSVDVGTTTGKIVQLAASDKLPAVDGSNLTAINAVQLQTRNIAATAPTATQVLGWNSANSTWEPQTFSVAGAGGFVNSGNSFGAAATLGTNDNFALNFEANNATAMTILPSGNVGIGSTNPAAKLHLAGSMQITGSAPWSHLAENVSIANQALTDSSAVGTTSVIGRTTAGKYAVGEFSDSYAFRGMIVENGYGTLYGNTWDMDDLTVGGATGLYVRDNTIRNMVAGELTMIDYGAGPDYRIHSNLATAAPAIEFTRSRGTESAPANVQAGDSIGSIYWLPRGASTHGAKLGAVVEVGTISGTSAPTQLQFETTPSGGTMTKRLVITANGNVGVGTTNPQSLLDVNGIVRATDICDENGANCKDISGGWGGGGDIDGVYTSTGLTGGFASGSGTLSVDVGTTTGKIVQVAASDKLPALDGSNLTAINAVKLQARDVAATAPTASQVMGWNAGNSTWEPQTISVAGGGGFVNSGNSFGAAATLGTNDNFALQFEANNATAMTILPNGNVGIGNLSPAARLDIDGGSIRLDNNQSILFDGNNGLKGNTSGSSFVHTYSGGNIRNYIDINNGSARAFEIYGDVPEGTTTGALFSVLDSGNVGIGTTSPNQLLTVEGPMSLRAQAAPSLTANYGKIYVDSGDSNKLKYMNPAGTVIDLTAGTGTAFVNGGNSFAGATTIGTNDNNALNLEANGSTAMTINPDGTVGVGNSGANVRMAVTGGLRVDNADQSNGHTWEYGLSFGSGSGEGITSKRAAGGNAYGLDLFTASTPRISITQTGNVGIGTSAPSYLLDVNGTSRTTTALVGDGAVATPSIAFSSATSTGLLKSGTGLGLVTSGTLRYIMDDNNIRSSNGNGFQLNNGASPSTATSPIYTRGGDTNTGLFFPNPDELAVTTGGTERLRFDANGNVGIGTTTPTSRLTVLGPTSGSSGVMATFANSGGTPRLEFLDEGGGAPARIYNNSGLGIAMAANGPVGLWAGNANRLHVLNTGNVGIGTSTPGSRLEVAGVIHSTTGGIRFPDGSIMTTSASTTTGNSSTTDLSFAADTDADTVGTIAFSVQGIEAMRVQNNGNIGIGTTTGSGRLNVQAATAGSSTVLAEFSNSSPASRFQFLDEGGGAPARIYNGTGLGIAMSSSGPVSLWSGGVERLRATNTGNVGIGTATPAGILDVRGGTGAASANGTAINLYAQNGGSGNTNGGDIILMPGNGSGTGNRGKVSIGSASTPSAMLGINGNSSVITLSPSIEFTDTAANANARNWGIFNGGAAYGNLDFKVGTAQGSGPWNGNVIMSLARDGSVGIGTTTPGSMLDVRGTASIFASTEGAATSVNSMANYTVPDLSRNVRRITLTANTILALPTIGTLATDQAFTLTIRVTQDATGNRTLTWDGNGNTIKWDLNAAPTPATAANTASIYQFTIIGGETVWYASQVWKEQ